MYIKVGVDGCGTGGTGGTGTTGKSAKLTLTHVKVICVKTNQINGKTDTKPQKRQAAAG